MSEIAALGTIHIKAAIASNPETSLTVQQQTSHRIVKKGSFILLIMPEYGYRPVYRIQKIKSIQSPHPELPGTIFDHSRYYLVGQDLPFPGALKISEGFTVDVKTGKPFVRPYPEIGQIRIQIDGLNQIMGQRIAVERIMLPGFEAAAVITAQPVLRSEPEIALSVLNNTRYGIVGQSVFLSDMVKDIGRPCFCGADKDSGGREEKKQYENKSTEPDQAHSGLVQGKGF